MTYAQPIYAPMPGRPAVPAQQQAQPRTAPVVRGVRPEELAPQPRAPVMARKTDVHIPTPEELGIGSRSAPPASRAVREELDWAQTRRQLQQVGATRFLLEQLTDGRSRFSCWVPDGAGSRLVQAEGSDEADAVRRCLAGVRR